VGVVDKSIADRICHSGVAQVFVIALRIELAGEDRGAVSVPVFKDLEDVVTLLVDAW
jgi:hypothetical protein